MNISTAQWVTPIIATVGLCGCVAPSHDGASGLTFHKREAHGLPGAPQASEDPDNERQHQLADRRAGSRLALHAEISDTTRPDDRSGELKQVIAELQNLGAIDPAAQQQLMEDLKRTDPALWPHLSQSLRASLAYRQRAVARPATLGEPESSPFVAASTPPGPQNFLPAATAFGCGDLRGEIPPVDSRMATVAARPLRQGETLGQSPHGEPRPNPTSQSGSSFVVQTGADSQQSLATAPIGAMANAAESNASRQAAYHEISPERDWRDPLARAIQSLETQLRDQPMPEPDSQSHLRMLYLVAGRRDEAMRPFSGVDATQQEFWSNEIYGLSTFLDAEREPDVSRRAAEATHHLNEATSRLGQLGPLVVRNLAFCTEVTSYGVYQKFEKEEFRPGQELLLYAEVEHFKSEATPRGHHTALKSHYIILDSQGQRAAEQEFPLTEEHCRNPRRDFFIRYFLNLPERIYDGRYTLQLTIEDTLGQKVGQSSIEFNVKAS